MSRGKLLRGYLLQFLRRVYPHGIYAQDIIDVFKHDFHIRTIMANIAYLVEKGYVAEEEKSHPAYRTRKVIIYRLTPKGVDLVEQTINDDGVTFDEVDRLEEELEL